MPTRITARTPQGNDTPLAIALIFVGLAVGAIFWTGSRRNATGPAAPPGERLYTQYCAACHGKSGEGNLALEAPALNSTGTIWQFTDGELQRAILTGGEIMPKHEQFLTTTEAADIIQYIKTWWTDEQLAGQQVLSQDDPLQP
jgi:mono/diheme cytochrome c family protein